MEEKKIKKLTCEPMSDLLGSIMSTMGDAPKNEAKKPAFGRIPKKQPLTPSGSTESETNKRPAPGPSSSSTPIPKRPFLANPSSSYGSHSSSSDSFNILEEINVQMNMFDVRITSMPEVIQRLHMDVILVASNDKKADVSKEKIGTGDLADHNKRCGLWSVFKNVIRLHPNLFNGENHTSIAYDCGTCIYLPDGIYRGTDEENIEFGLEGTEETTSIIQLGRKKIMKVEVKIMPTGYIYTRGKRAMEPSNCTELIRCIEIVTSQILNGERYMQIGSSVYRSQSDEIRDQRSGRFIKDPSTQFDSEGKEIKTGFHKSVRMVTGNGNQDEPQLVINVDCRRSPFYQEMSATRMFTLLLSSSGRGGGGGGNGYGGRGGRGDDRRDDRRDRRDRDVLNANDVSPEDVHRAISIMKSQSDQRTKDMLDELRGVAVWPTHMNDTRNTMFYIHQFELAGAKSISFEMKTDGGVRSVSVYDYFLEKYNYRLKYPDLPLAIERKCKSVSYYPLEVLVIRGGQRVKQHNIPACIQSEMTGKLAMLPEKHVKLHQSVLVEHLHAGNNPHLSKFGISIAGNNTQPIQLRAKILPAPQIEFNSRRTVQPETGPGKRPNIMAKGARFIRPAHINSILVINFDNTSLQMDRFCEMFADWCQNQGIRIDKPARNWRIVNCRERNTDELREIMERAKSERVSLVLAVTKEKRPDVHDTLKMMEAQIGVQTYHLSQQTCQKMMDRGSTTIDNVIRKLNLKAGGLNFTISVPQKARNVAVCKNTKAMNDKLFKRTMFVGFELSHAGANCLFDQQDNIVCGEPSVVGVSYSLGESTNLGGFTYLQPPREHRLLHLTKHFPKTVLDHYRSTKELPEKIVVYRAGTGEGDFEKLREEANEMRECLKTNPEIGKISRGQYSPRFLFMVVLKNSHYRVFPERIYGSKSFDQNVPSGTCIDTTVTGFGFQEFILISQSALIGTIRPARYTVLVNDMGWPLNEIYHLTYFSAFGHQVSYQPPGMPDVLYGAENLAKRGKNNFKAYQKTNNVRRARDGESDDAQGSHMENLSDMLNRCTITSRNFWA